MRAVITVIGKDMVGILARVSGQCAQHRINVLEVTQSILQDMFAMIMMVDIAESDIPFTAFADELAAIGQEMHLSIHAMHEDIFNAMHTIYGPSGAVTTRKARWTACSMPTIYWKPSP